MLQQGAAGLRRFDAGAAAHQKRSAECELHLADAGGGGRQGQVRPLGAVGNAAGLNDMPEQIQVGQIILFGFTWALLHHMLGGIRHLIWDLIYGFEPAEREMLTLASLIGSIALTIVIWVIGYLAMGGPR